MDDKKELRARLEQGTLHFIILVWTIGLTDLLCAVGDGEGDGWGYDVFPFHDEEFSYALGAQVRTTRTHGWDWFCVFELGRAHLVVSRLPALTSVDLSGFPLPDMRSLCSLCKRTRNLLVCGCSLAHSRGLVRRRGAWKLPCLSVHMNPAQAPV